MVNTENGNWLNRLVSEFEQAWQGAINGREPPRLHEFVAHLGGDDLVSALIHLVAVDITFTNRVPSALEDYLQAWPLLHGHEERLEQAIEAYSRTRPQQIGQKCSTYAFTGQDIDTVVPASAGETDLVAVFRDRFKLLEKLGEGSFGRVYRALDTSTDRIIALKVVQPRCADEATTLFSHEARNAGRIGKHPNIVQILEPGDNYIVYEYVQGITLLDLVVRSGRLDPIRAAAIVRAVADAVQHTHEAGVVHLDIKPANILIRAKDNEPMLTDYGIAVQEEQLVNLRGTRGSRAYMAPEQILGDTKSFSPRTDVWALGVVLYHALCGELPFRGRGPDLDKRILNTDPFSARSRHGTIPESLEAICQRALQKKPGDRYQSAAAMAEALGAFTTDLEKSGTLRTFRFIAAPRRFWATLQKTDANRRRGLIALMVATAFTGWLFVVSDVLPYKPDRTEVARLLTNHRWVTYDPREFHPEFAPSPKPDSIAADLRLIRDAGFTGIITFGSDNTLAEIPRIWKYIGQQTDIDVAVIMGIWDPTSRSELARAAAQSRYADAYCVGHNGLTRQYYMEDLQPAIETLRRVTRRPVTTTDEYPRYLAMRELATIGDWLFPDVHNSLDTHQLLRGEEVVADSVHLHAEFTRTIAQFASESGRPLMLKMVMFPHRSSVGTLIGASGDCAQRDFFQRLGEVLRLPESQLPVSVNIAAHSAFDIPWKQPPRFNVWDAYTGLLDEKGRPRPAVMEIVNR
ncbi:MAG: serine/threonine protein kinase [Planctomycetia bacterium]|nr:serine/threonine protein kinase [Planctomycetia bacterium]